MLNCQQVKSIMAESHEEMQELLNAELRRLGSRVVEVDFCNTLMNGFGANIIYWSQDIPAAMTCKLDTLPAEPEAEDGAALFVAVMHDCQRELVFQCMMMAKKELMPIISDRHKELFDRTMARFAPDKEEQLE